MYATISGQIHFSSLIPLILFYIYSCFASMYAHASCYTVPLEAGREHWISWDWSYTLGAT